MTSEVSFAKFLELPAELRLKVWREASAGPSMHVFDVCFPSWRGNERSRRAFQDDEKHMSDSQRALWDEYSQCVFLDAVEIGPADLRRTIGAARHAHDPSVYKFRWALRMTSTEAYSAVVSPMRSATGGNTNTVCLPGRKKKIVYDNEGDVLFLRFRDGNALTDLSQGVLFGEYETSGVNMLSEVLEGQWSAEMASTLHNARCIALDIAEMWTAEPLRPVHFEEAAYLACCLQEDLRVLYLVDHCPGRCRQCKRQDTKASRLQSRGELYQKLHTLNFDAAMTKEPDVIHGVGMTYREVFDLEGLGWSDDHPSYVFARAMDEEIRSQQADANAQKLQGLRVLLVEDGDVGGPDTIMLLDCHPNSAPNCVKQTQSWNMNLPCQVAAGRSTHVAQDNAYSMFGSEIGRYILNFL